MPERTAKRKAMKESQSRSQSQAANTAKMSSVNKKPRQASEGDRDLQKERKRATDRQAQRMARERTKQYIAHLEKTIEILRKENGSETVSKLLQERNALALEVQHYRKVMYGMRLAIDGAISGDSSIQPEIQGRQVLYRSGFLHLTDSSRVYRRHGRQRGADQPYATEY